MCNRYRLKARPDELVELFDLPRNAPPPAVDGEYFPGQSVPVVRQTPDTRRLAAMTWGFPPFKGKRPVNQTRSEGAAASPFWRPHLGNRCAFPISQAIEWQHQVDPRTGELRKVPHTLGRRDGGLIVVAGIYMADSGAGDDDAACCSMMTCRANRLWSSIHNADPNDPRMVCMLLDCDAVTAWLDPGQPFAVVRDLLRPVPDELDLLVAKPLAPDVPDNTAHPQNPAIESPGLFG